MEDPRCLDRERSPAPTGAITCEVIARLTPEAEIPDHKEDT
jgi:hypothetical protein